MKMNNSMVAHVWAHGRSGKGSNLKSDGISLYSYRSLIAAKIDGIIYLSSNTMSMSTGRHISYARGAMNHEQENIFYTPAFSWSGRDPALTHEAMILPAVREALQTVENAIDKPRAHKVTKLQAIASYMRRRAEILQIAGRVGFTLPDMPEMSVDIAAIEAYTAQRAAARAENARKEAAARELLRQEDAEQFTQWLAGGAVHFPSSYYGAGTDYLRVLGETVQTSRGAECPLDHVKKALRFYHALPAGQTWKTNGHKIPLGMFMLDEIDAAGNALAGCHKFTAAEIARFAVTLQEN
jgi:hypothetical protein